MEASHHQSLPEDTTGNRDRDHEGVVRFGKGEDAGVRFIAPSDAAVPTPTTDRAPRQVKLQMAHRQ